MSIDQGDLVPIGAVPERPQAGTGSTLRNREGTGSPLRDRDAGSSSLRDEVLSAIATAAPECDVSRLATDRPLREQWCSRVTSEDRWTWIRSTG